MANQFTRVESMAKDLGAITPEIMKEIARADKKHANNNGVRKVAKLYMAELKAAEHVGYASGYIKGSASGIFVGAILTVGAYGGWQLYRKAKQWQDAHEAKKAQKAAKE